ncbi:alanine racemase [Specibacter cremeus]|uniref:alanine racemase n=1 Tax=Specibacter cremeus TaxID=1629051 RepID=UPI001F0CD76D|nr:alanine racemase [Specibacter cremeus]
MNKSAYPQLRLNLEALEHNIETMAAWCRDRNVLLAPHVKTTMSASVIERQMTAGAVGVTVATVDQVETVLGWGHRDILVANQVVDRLGLTRIKAWLDADPNAIIRIFADSAAGVALAADIFSGDGRPLQVLLDVGTPGGRTGVRDAVAAGALAELVVAAPGLRLVGVAGYEGVVPNSRDVANLAAVDGHCKLVHDIFVEVADLIETDGKIFSMGGSAFPDRVVEFLPTDAEVPGTIRLLRSGCYATHDHGTYAGVTPIPGLIPALTVRAVVVSAPEDGLVVVGAGKRDLPYDAGLPTLLSACTADGAAKAGARATVHTLFDHHAVLLEAQGLGVTDIVELGISHPCSAFDRWPEYLVTDTRDHVADVWHTDFHRGSIADA